MNLKYTIGMFIISAIIMTGCVGDLSSGEIQERLIEANTNIKSYMGRFTDDMEMTMTVRGKLITTQSNGKADVAFDRENKRMKMVSITNLSQDGSDSEIGLEWYVVDGYSYTKIEERWTKSVFNADIWENQDQMEFLLASIKEGTVEQLPDDSFNEKSYHVFEVKPNMDRVLNNALLSAGQYLNEEAENFIKKNLFMVWINKDNYVIEKMITELHIDIPPSESENGRMRQGIEMVSNMEFQFFNINQEVTIELPAEALNIPNKPLSSGSGTAAPRERNPPKSRGGGAAADTFDKSSLKQKLKIPIEE